MKTIRLIKSTSKNRNKLSRRSGHKYRKIFYRQFVTEGTSGRMGDAGFPYSFMISSRSWNANGSSLFNHSSAACVCMCECVCECMCPLVCACACVCGSMYVRVRMCESMCSGDPTTYQSFGQFFVGHSPSHAHGHGDYHAHEEKKRCLCHCIVS